MKTQVFVLEGLNCANCAGKIEESLKNNPLFESVVFDFISKKLKVSPVPKAKNIKNIIQSTCDKIEDGINVIEFDEINKKENESKKINKNLIQIIISLPLFALGIVLLLFSSRLPEYFEIISSVLLALSAVAAGYDVAIRGVKSIFKLSLDENTLMSIAVFAAFCIGEFFEGAIVAILFKVGEYLEDRAVASSRRNIEKLADICPDTASLVNNDGTITNVPAQDVPIGSMIAVKPYERVPIDGFIIEGSSMIDTSALTGESMAVYVEKDSEILSGSMNTEGFLVIKTTALHGDSAATRIISLVEDAVAKKGKTEKFITRFAKYYTPIVTLLAIFLVAVPTLIFAQPFQIWFERALVFLVASCPCALVISVPLGFYSAIGASSKKGILIKGSRYIESLSKADCVVVDKTGTLTLNQLAVDEIVPLGDYSKNELLNLAATAEKHSSHPIALSLQKAAKDLPRIEEFENYYEKSSLGVKAVYNGQQLLCGGEKLFTANGYLMQDLPLASVYLGIDGKIEGYFNFSDTIKADSVESISEIKKLGIEKIVMLTGDKKTAAKKIADLCKINEYHAELLPEEKLEHLENLKKNYKNTIFVGDGINDAPVLAASSVGISMGLGADAAIEASDVILTTDSLAKLPLGISLARKSMGVIRFNIIASLSIKILVLILAALGFAPMWLAVFSDVGITFLAVLNSSRILKF